MQFLKYGEKLSTGAVFWPIYLGYRRLFGSLDLHTNLLPNLEITSKLSLPFKGADEHIDVLFDKIYYRLNRIKPWLLIKI